MSQVTQVKISTIHRSKTRSRDQGVILWWIAMLLVPLAGVAAFVIDLSLQQGKVRDLQRVADAAAFAAGRQLDGSLAGYQKAKRVFLATLRMSQILGLSNQLTGTVQFQNLPGTKLDPFETDPRYQWNALRVGDLTISLERGTYWSDEDGSDTFTFNSLEGNLIRYNLPIYAVSNAARAVVALGSQKTVFGGILGFESFHDVQRVSVTSYDRINQVEVAPFAIKACELLLDSDASDSTPYVADRYYSSQQCGREIRFNEAAWKDGGQARTDGLRRSDRYVRFRYKIDTDGVPVIDPYTSMNRGTLGIPQTSGVTPLPADEFVTEFSPILNGSSPGFPIWLGQGFRPVEDMVGVAGGPLDNPIFRSKVRNWIMGGLSFNASFSGQNGEARPYLRGLRNDFPPIPTGDRWIYRELVYNATGGLPVYLFPMANLLNPNQSSPYNPATDNPWNDTWSNTQTGAWTDPLCHDHPALSASPSDPGIPRNHPDAKAKKVRVMLVAPADEIGGVDNPDSRYCDYNELYTVGTASSSEILSTTKPRIVGWIWAYVFDFNFTQLSDNPPTPGDRTSIMNPYQFEDDDLSDTSLPAGAQRCSVFQDCGTDWSTLSYFPYLANFTNDSNGNGNPDICDSLATPLTYPGPLDPGYPNEYPDPWHGTTAAGIAALFPWSSPMPHCLPSKKLTTGCSYFNLNCWEVRNMSVGWGCGGIRARGSCLRKSFWGSDEGDANNLPRPSTREVSSFDDVA